MTNCRWLALLLVGCVAPQPNLKPITGDDVTVFVHGYQGGFLKTESDEYAWITIGEALSKGDRSLAFQFNGQREVPRFGPLAPAGPVTRLTVIPWILEQEAYAKWMQWAKDALPGFIPWTYDWRLDIRESGAALCSFIDELGPNKRVRIVAHSMGGLVALQCLRKGPESVRSAVKKVVFVAVPFKGGPGQWDDLHVGTKVRSNTKLLGAEALLTMPAAWQLLPPVPDMFFDENGERKDLPAFDAATWLEGKWGLFSDPAVAANPAYRRQLEERLEAHRVFWQGFGDEEGPAPAIEVMAVIGKGRKTVRGWTVKPDGSFDFDKPLLGDGDGTVLSEFAHPPKPFKVTVVESPDEHTAMLRQSEVQTLIADFLRY